MVEKTIKVSKKVHEELEIRKYRNETFDEVLRRVLGLVPQTVRELTTSLPQQLQFATHDIVEDYIVPGRSFRRIANEKEKRHILSYISKDSNKIISQVSVSFPDPPERVNYRVEFSYRNPQGELTRAAQIRNIEDDSIDILYRNAETLEEKENTRRGENAGQKAAELIGEHISTFLDQSLKRWG